ncbi:MAG: DNA-binding protein HU [Candidatus Yanofskybacteria bacterium GW2011_GWA1_41_6]|uniref:DNA-binding protein HU n=1 Tax=Candidatus Yanofskybacteria bacterium GW2011_GWA1_41_6 TaxID=1619020 RepID=A0A0G0WMC9_9BACT|nr:MAG: DNA-binding protein HU [Candidatus Yanofskybacteria bacterium GW2011_GWA1_41_6]
MVKKNQLAQVLADKFEISKKQGMEWLDATFDEIAKVIKGGDKVNISGFGIFRVADRKAREARNPKTGETVHVKASKAPKFRASKVLKELVQ